MENPLERHIREERSKCAKHILHLKRKLEEAETKKKLLDSLLETAESLASSSPANGGLIGRALQMIADSDEGLTYKEIESQLREEGCTVNEKSLQTQLLTRRKRGFIERDDDGRYTWTGQASEDGDDLEPDQGAIAHGGTNGTDATARA